MQRRPANRSRRALRCSQGEALAEGRPTLMQPFLAVKRSAAFLQDFLLLLQTGLWLSSEIFLSDADHRQISANKRDPRAFLSERGPARSIADGDPVHATETHLPSRVRLSESGSHVNGDRTRCLSDSSSPKTGHMSPKYATRLFSPLRIIPPNGECGRSSNRGQSRS
jgi:hypothetical protein